MPASSAPAPRPAPASAAVNGAVLLCVSAWTGWSLDLLGALSSPTASQGGPWWVVALGLAAGFAAWTAMLAPPLAVGTFVLRRFRGSELARPLLIAGAGVLVWAVVFATAVNWLMYRRTGAFVGLDGWRFFAFNAGQVLLHVVQVEGRLLGLMAGLSVVLAAAALWSIRLAGRRAAAHRWFLTVSVCWALVGIVAMTATAEPSARGTLLASQTDPPHSIPAAPPSIEEAIFRVSPIAALLLESLDRTAAASEFPIDSSRRIWTDDPQLDVLRLQTMLAPQMERAGYTLRIQPGTGRLVTAGRVESSAPVPPRDPAADGAELGSPVPPMDLPLSGALRDMLLQENKRILSMDDYLRQAGDPAVPPYNVIFITIDSLRADRLTTAARNPMPNFVALARRSVSFTQAYAHSNHSDYADTCPLSSQYPLRSRNHYLPSAPIEYPRVLLYDILKARGYRTAMFSSQNESWAGMLNFLDTGSLDTIVHGGTFPGPTYLPPDDAIFTWRWLEGAVRAGKIEDRQTVHAALEWIAQDPGRPFFCSLTLQDSHFPYLWPDGQPAVFQPADLTGLGVELGGARGVSFFGYPPSYLDRMRNRYDTSLRYIDQLLGEIVTQLTARDLMDRTILIVTGDTGELFHEHGAVTHAGPLWQEALRVPLVMHAPGVPPRRIARPVQHIDVAPTALALLGLPPHPAFQGRNALVEPAGPPPPVYAITQLPWIHQSAVIWNGYKLVYDHRNGTSQLYDLQSDPGEQVNRVSENPAIARQLHEWMRRWYLLQLVYYENPEIHSRFYPPN